MSYHDDGAHPVAQSESRYMLAQDNDCHWYLIPASIWPEWQEWLDIPSDDERAWAPPKGAQMIDGYQSITFTNPIGRTNS